MTEKKKAVFFDRDGILNHDCGYTHKIQDFFWLDGAKEAVKLCKDNGYLTFVVTNQSGVARGLYKEEDIKTLHDFMQEELKKEGTYIDEFMYCPHHPDGIVSEYSIDCDCRKPKSGMLLALADKYSVDIANSFLVGDNPRDVESAENIGVKGYLFEGSDIYAFINSIIKNA